MHKCRQHCTLNKYNKCKARFPRSIVQESFVDPFTGSITLKKLEEWINFFTPVLTYLLRSNSDVTSLLSGTAIKAIVAYVTEYITKVPLKTHVMFDTIRKVLGKHSELINDVTVDDKQKSRKLITSIVNTLTVGMEIGGPMACLYLLDNPDHYTSHKFRPFYWKPYVQRCREFFVSHINTEHEPSNSADKVIILNAKASLVGYTTMLDYTL